MTKEQSKLQRAKVSQRPSVSSSKASAKDEEASAKDERYFKKTTYIKGFGIVNAEDKLTSEMAIAWSSNTKVKIDAYVGAKDECLISK